MQVSASTRSLLAKALRVSLVFMLVFWMTFRIEMVAFADDEPTVGDGTVQTEEPESDPQPQPDPTPDPQPDNPTEPSDSGESGGTGTDDPTSGSQGSGSGASSQQDENATTFRNLEIHLYIDKPEPEPESTDPMSHVGSFVYDYKAESPQSSKPKIDTVGGELKFVAVVVDADGNRSIANDMVEWGIASGDESAAFVKATDTVGVLKAKGEADAEVVATCKLTGSAYSTYKIPSDTTIEAQFKVDVIEQAGAYVESIELLDADGNVCQATDTLKVELEGGSLAYQFAARITVRDPSPSASAPTYTITTSDLGDLSDHDKKIVESLRWSVADSEDASIDETGLFKTNTKLETTVMCATGMGHGGASVSASTTVNTGIDPDVQGASHPQDTLLVIVPSDVVKTGDDDATAPAAGDGSGEESDVTASGQAATADGSEESENAQSESSDQAEEPDASAAKPEPVSKPYSLSDLSALGWTTVTYTFQGAASATSGDSTTITGAGPSLVSILEDAGVDFSKVRSVTFVNYQGDSKTISWSSLGGEESGAVLAANSLVHVDGEDAPSSEADLLKNTRYRLLIGDGVSVESALPWVNTIRVNGDGSGEGGSGTTDSSLRAVIGYMPVAKGNTAILSASVVGLYQGEQFGYVWQDSKDGGVTWSDTDDTSQTLRVPTSDGTIGRMYRVVATTNNGRKAESDPVTISENAGFAVSLAYDPPLAGEMAFFTTSVTGVDPADITDYIWEFTEDGGATWQEIAGSRGNSTFSARTDPVEDTTEGSSDAEGDDAESQDDGSTSGESDAPDKEIDTTPAASMWVHVRVLATGGREAVSNPVMLTVHVSEDPGSGQVPTEDIPEQLPDEPSAPGTDDPVVMPTEPDEPTDVAPAPTPVVQEVSSITTETSPRSESTSTATTIQPPATQQTPDGTETQPTPESQPTEAPTDLIVNPEVTAEILEQQQAVNEVVQATHPGARWTALSTVDPDGNDVQRILSDNPFAPFTAPFALGITVAGAVEKLLGFRRQTK